MRITERQWQHGFPVAAVKPKLAASYAANSDPAIFFGGGVEIELRNVGCTNFFSLLGKDAREGEQAAWLDALAYLFR